jgi:ligand-binding sensor protein
MTKQKADLSETLKLEFKNDLALFEYFLVLLSGSSPIRNVELMWADDLELFDPMQGPRVNTGDTLVQLQPVNADTPERSSPSPSTHFCDLVHGFGAHEETTCARSDRPAKELCRATGRSQVYPCHVGLTDIAVPVVCEGRYLGTLFSGQVLTEPPTPEGFARVRKALQGQSHIDLARLEEVYYRVPVVTTAQLAEMVRMLEVFARYLTNAWKRLEIMSELQRLRERELALERRKLAEMFLAGQVGSGEAGNQESLRELARNVGLERLPDRVLVFRFQISTDEIVDPLESGPPSLQGDVRAVGGNLALVRLAHLIEDRCQNWPNTLATVVAPGEMCIFTSQKSRTQGNDRMLLDEMAQTLLRVASSQGFALARVGLSGIHPQSTELLRAYHEAASALESGHSMANWFEPLPEYSKQPEQALNRVLKALQSADPAGITVACESFWPRLLRQRLMWRSCSRRAVCSLGLASIWRENCPRWELLRHRSIPPKSGRFKSWDRRVPLPWPRPFAVMSTSCGSKWCNSLTSGRKRSWAKPTVWCANWGRRR